MLGQIEAIMQEKIRPQLARHEGDIRVLELKDGVLRFELLGRCAGCPSAGITTEELVRSELKQALPQLTDVVLVEHVSEDLLAQARRILGRHRAETQP